MGKGWLIVSGSRDNFTLRSEKYITPASPRLGSLSFGKWKHNKITPTIIPVSNTLIEMSFCQCFLKLILEVVPPVTTRKVLKLLKFSLFTFKVEMLQLLHDTLYFQADPVGAKTSYFYENVIFSVPRKFWQTRIWLFLFLSEVKFPTLTFLNLGQIDILY